MTTIIGPRTSAAPAPILVNGTVIPRSAIAREVQHHPAPSPSVSWHRAAAALVVRELLLQEARRDSLRPTPKIDRDGRRETDEEATVRTLVEANVRVAEPTGQELRRYYAANPAKFRTPDIVEARHILIAARKSDEAGYATAHEKAEVVAREVAARPERFADVARSHSDCASSEVGGHLGQLLPGDATPEFEAALAQLGEGETTASPVATRYGFHIIRLERRIPGRLLPFELVAARISAYLVDRARRLMTARYLKKLVSRAEISGIELRTPGLTQ